jgi:decaprenylphospho-beta-D-ribofuranose 2-oxidase
MTYEPPTLWSRITEVSVIVAFVLACINARGQGRRWLSTVVWGAAAGFGAEIYLVNFTEHPRYHYNTSLFWFHVKDVPILIGLGWGMVFYAATWTAQRLHIKSLWQSSFLAGGLGVSLDISLDPAATLHRFWVWHPLPNMKAEMAESWDKTLFGVPFDNFIAWMVLIGVYGGLARAAFHWLNKRKYGDATGPAGGAALSGQGSFWVDWLVPLVAAVIAALAFGLVRGNANRFYEWIGREPGAFGQLAGEVRLFTWMFVVGMAVFWVRVLRASRNEDVNWVVLIVVAYFHLLSYMLLLTRDKSETRDVTPLLILIPVNMIAGLLAYAWPSLDALFERHESAQGGTFKFPRLVMKTLRSYGGKKVRALVCAPQTKLAFDTVLRFAKEGQKRVTFRTGGQAFDTQSLNQQIVISLEKLEGFKTVRLDAAQATVTVGGGATWREILKTTLPQGFVPYIMVTSSAASVGGTLSANSVSRFSPTCGREGKYVQSIKVLTPDGQVRECSPNSADETGRQLFSAVVGGLGYVGVVLEITYKLWRVPTNAVVKTEFRLVEGFGRIRDAIQNVVVPLALETRSTCRSRPASQPPLALSAALNMRGGAWGLIARSEYVDLKREGGKLKRSIFHDPTSFRHLFLQFCATIPFLRAVGYFFTYRLAYRGGPKTFLDDAFGYTFFEDGNRRLRRILHWLEVPSRILQQTFVIPWDPENAQDERLSSFLQAADAHLDGKGLTPALVDVLYVGRDEHEFYLSSSQGLDGFAVTFTFERLFRSIQREETAMVELSKLCQEHGGRVHLVKNVHADAELIRQMYGSNLDSMASVRRSTQANTLLRNEFSERILPGM